MSKTKNLPIFLLMIFNLSTLFAFDTNSFYRDNTAAYIQKITHNLVEQYTKSQQLTTLQEGTILLYATRSSHDYNSTLPITQHIDENLIYEMNQCGFKVVDTKALDLLKIPKTKTKYALFSTYTNYKHEMVINSRIIKKEDGVVIATAQVRVPRRVLRDVEKLYDKDGWFNKQEK